MLSDSCARAHRHCHHSGEVSWYLNGGEGYDNSDDDIKFSPQDFAACDKECGY